MKSNRILCLLLSIIMLMCAIQMPAFAEEETRTYIIEANCEEVYAGDEFEVTIRIDGQNIFGAEWNLKYDPLLFDCIHKPNEFYINMSNTPLKATDIIATYRFRAIAQTSIENGAFTVAEGAVAETREESIVNKHVEPEKTPADVTILLKDGLDTKITVDDIEVGDSKTVTYKDVGYTIKFDPVVDGVSDSEAEIEINYENNVQTDKEFTFIEPGTYEFKYSTTKKGYIPDADRTFTLVIEKDAFDVTPKFDGAVVDLNDSETIVFDGVEHKFEVEVVPGVEDPKVSIQTTLNGEPCNLEDLKFTADGNYAITYKIERQGFTTVDGQFSLNISKANLDVSVTIDGIPINNEEVKEITYDSLAHKVLITSEPAADIKVWVNEVLTPVNELDFTEVKDYKIKYEITRAGYTTEQGNFTINISDPKYYVEVKNDFTANEVGSKTIVLVYTDSDKISFSYGTQNLTMYEVTSKGYEYVGTETFTQTNDTKVYALVVEYITSGDFNDYYNKVKIVYSPISEDYVIDVADSDKFDLDGSGDVDISDPVTAFGVYWGQDSYYNDHMKIVLMTDVDGDKDVDGLDTGKFKTEYENTKKATD